MLTCGAFSSCAFGVQARVLNCGVVLSASQNATHAEGSSYITRQIFEDMDAFIAQRVPYMLLDNMDDACHRLIFAMCLLRLVRV